MNDMGESISICKLLYYFRNCHTPRIYEKF